MIRSGQVDLVLVVGFEVMKPGPIGSVFHDRKDPLGDILKATQTHPSGDEKAPFAPKIFGQAALLHQHWYGSTQEHLARIAAKNHTQG